VSDEQPQNPRAPKAKAQKTGDWVLQAADTVLAFVGERRPIVCASGISPSGPIHLGNLREVMTTHLVAEELRRRGHEVIHHHSWDDFDRLRKVPANIDPSFVQHIGRPIAEIPDPFGEYDSWATRFITEFEQACARLGIQPRWVRQSKMYRAGAYVEGIRTALRRRFEIFDILARYQTEKLQDKPIEERRAEYWPFQVYCEVCNKDSTQVTAYDDATDTITYRCVEHGERSFVLGERCPGKLVWKVDWPMRWAYEGVVFEPGGEDHSTPGGSYTVGCDLAPTIYGVAAPCYVGYGFVGMAGRTKISSSAGTNATPEFALRFIEPALLRWLYIRRAVGTKFTIEFGSEIWRAYDEWDAFCDKARAEGADEVTQGILARSLATSAGPVAQVKRAVPFRLLWSSADMTEGRLDQILRIVAHHVEDPPDAATLEAEIQPRLACATGWVENCLPEDERLSVRADFDAEAHAALDPQTAQGVALLAERLAAHWSLTGLTEQVYGVPKDLLGLPRDIKPTPELQVAQRAFFKALYTLILGKETGPRLPTLFLSLGLERTRRLLIGA